MQEILKQAGNGIFMSLPLETYKIQIRCRNKTKRTGQALHFYRLWTSL